MTLQSSRHRTSTPNTFALEVHEECNPASHSPSSSLLHCSPWHLIPSVLLSFSFVYCSSPPLNVSFRWIAMFVFTFTAVSPAPSSGPSIQWVLNKYLSHVNGCPCCPPLCLQAQRITWATLTSQVSPKCLPHSYSLQRISWQEIVDEELFLFLPPQISVKDHGKGGASRWRKSKTRRSPSSPQIHQKYIYTWNCSYRKPTECWQKTSGLPKGNKLLMYLGRVKEKRKNGDKRIGTGPAPVGGSCEGGKVSTH